MNGLLRDVRYQAASPADLPGVRALLEACDLPCQDLTVDHLAEFVICRHGAALVGCVGLEPFGGEALLRSLAVAAAFRGLGMGHELWSRSRQRARDNGVSTLYLLTTTAEALFARWGFRRIPREQTTPAIRSTAQFASMCPVTAALMKLDLDAGGGSPVAAT